MQPRALARDESTEGAAQESIRGEQPDGSLGGSCERGALADLELAGDRNARALEDEGLPRLPHASHHGHGEAGAPAHGARLTRGLAEAQLWQTPTSSENRVTEAAPPSFAPSPAPAPAPEPSAPTPGSGTGAVSASAADPTFVVRSVRAGQSVRVGVLLGVLFLLASVAWDALVAPGHVVRLFAWRGGGAAFLLAAGALSYALPHRAMWLGALSTTSSAVSITAAALILPYGFAYAIGALVLVAMAIGFVSLDGRAAGMSSVGVLVASAAVLFINDARDDTFYAIGFFVLPALAAATVFAHLNAERAARARAVRRELVALREDLARFGRSDELTGVHDGKQLQALARREIALARRRKTSLSVLKIDVARLGSINQQHGRRAGDEALRAVASMCQAALRETDALGRLAGDEFVALLPDADDAGAGQICERMRKSLGKVSVLAGDRVLEVGISVGWATLADADRSIEDLMRRADADLRSSQEHAGNRDAPRESAPAAS